MQHSNVIQLFLDLEKYVKVWFNTEKVNEHKKIKKTHSVFIHI